MNVIVQKSVRAFASFRLYIIVIRSEQFTSNLEMLWESRDFIIFGNHVARWHINSDISRNMCS